MVVVICIYIRRKTRVHTQERGRESRRRDATAAAEKKRAAVSRVERWSRVYDNYTCLSAKKRIFR